MNVSSPRLVVLAHGTTDPVGIEQIYQWVDAFSKTTPYPVNLAWLEKGEPTLDVLLTELTQTCRHIIICPLLLFKAGHVKRDLPEMVQRIKEKDTNLRIDTLATIGNPKRIVDAWLSECEHLGFEVDEISQSVLALGRGGRMPSATGVFDQMQKRLERAIKRPIDQAFSGLQKPSVPELLAKKASSHDKASFEWCFPCLLFDGLLLQRAKQQCGPKTVFFPVLSQCSLFNRLTHEQWHREIDVLLPGR